MNHIQIEGPVCGGQPGEIGGRGALMMLGYFGSQAATEKTFNRHSYLMSGDIGSFDKNGILRIAGRAKDLIILGEHKICPSRIESLALTQPAVEKAAAFWGAGRTAWGKGLFGGDRRNYTCC